MSLGNSNANVQERNVACLFDLFTGPVIKMPRLTNDQRVWLCLEYARVNNACEVQRRWAERWGNLPAPTKRTVMKTYRKFVHEGTCHNLNKGRSGRRRTARTAENIELVRQSLTENGQRSGRRNGLALSRTTFQRIVKIDIKFHPYVIIRRQKLREGDPAQRLAFCNRLVNTVARIPDFLDKLLVSDEAVFSLNSEINSRNVRKYAARGDGPPQDHYVEFMQGAQQIMVWVGLTRQGVVLGPHFAERNLDTREYIRIIRYNVIQRDFHTHNIDRDSMWWQQDGASCHTSNATMRYLRGQFPGRLMSKRGDWPWPPRSPDLTVCDFFLWGYLKHQIWNVPHDEQPHNLRELREAIVAACRNLDAQMIRNSFDCMLTRARKCILAAGHAFPNE